MTSSARAGPGIRWIGETPDPVPDVMPDDNSAGEIITVSTAPRTGAR